MALSAANSEVIGTNACNGVLRVCLAHDDGAPFYDQFDICGGPATGTTSSTTGPVTGSLSSCSLTNFATENGKQCFDLNNYTPASNSATSDTIVVQPTDASNNPVGNAVAIPVSFAACDGSGGPDCGCDNSAIVEHTQGTGDFCLLFGDIGIDGTVCSCSLTGFAFATSPPPIGFQTSVPGCLIQIIANQIDAATPGDYPFSYTVTCNGEAPQSCTGTLRVVAASGGGIICAQSSTTPLNVNAGQTYAASSFGTNGTAPYTVTAATPGILQIDANGNLQIVPGTTPGDYTRSVTVEDANGDEVTCTIIFRVSASAGGDCFDTGASYATLDTSTAGPGDTITINSFAVDQDGNGMPGYYLLVKDAAGNIQATAPAFSTTVGTEQQWTWQVPQGCTDGTYRVCMYPPQGSSCPLYDAAGLAVTGCGGSGGTCKTAQVSLVAGSSTTITPGQVVAGSTAFGSASPATSANGAVAAVGAQSAGAITVSGVSVGVTTIAVDMGNGVVCNCTINVTASTGCSSAVTSLVASPANPSPGQTVTLTAGGCTCTGCVVRITQQIVAGMPTVQLSNGGETVGGGSVTYQHPATMTPGQSLRFNTQCCCPDN